jgi:hypothetical protein
LSKSKKLNVFFQQLWLCYFTIKPLTIMEFFEFYRYFTDPTILIILFLYNLIQYKSVATQLKVLIYINIKL